MAQRSDIRVEVKPFQVIVQMQSYDWDIALELYQRIMGEVAYENFARMLQGKLQATAGV